MFEAELLSDDGFDGVVEEIRQRVNFLYGYGDYLKRKSLDEDVLEEGLELVRRATNLRQAVNDHAKIIRDEKDRKISVIQKTKGMGWGLGDEAKHVAKLDKQEAIVIGKAWLIEKLAGEFSEYLANNELAERRKYNKKDDDNGGQPE